MSEVYVAVSVEGTVVDWNRRLQVNPHTQQVHNFDGVLLEGVSSDYPYPAAVELNDTPKTAGSKIAEFFGLGGK